MSTLDRLLDAVKSVVELRGDVDRVAAQLRQQADLLLDHEKRLIRLETFVEIGQIRARLGAPEG